MKDLQFAVTFGVILRNMHRWSAHAMVAVVFLHMCRVFWTGSYKTPREFNWVVGVLLFLLTLALSFTGYLLPWDQLAFWAITVGTNIAAYAPLLGDQVKFLLLGGHVIGPMTLLRFYVMHCVILPLAMLLLISLHVWRVRKDGLSGAKAQMQPVEEVAGAFPASTKTDGLVALTRRPKASVEARDPNDEVFAWPDLLYRELLVALAVIVTLHIVSLVFTAPLEEMADPTRTPNPAKAPWYFLGLQELVHYSALIGGVIVPTLLVIALLALPCVDRNKLGSGRWFAPERRLANTAFTALVAVFVGQAIVGTFFRGPNWAPGLAMEVKTPTPTRLHVLFACLGLSFLLIFSWVMYREETAEWRSTQARFRQLERTRKNPHQLAQSASIGGLRQVWLPELGRVDRCGTCHLGIDDPAFAGAPAPFAAHPGTWLSTHPTDRFGCTVCHDGQGQATDFANAAHQPQPFPVVSADAPAPKPSKQTAARTIAGSIRRARRALRRAGG